MSYGSLVATRSEPPSFAIGTHRCRKTSLAGSIPSTAGSTRHEAKSTTGMWNCSPTAASTS